MKNENVLLSIICTAYNHEKFIKSTIEGFLKQKTNFKFEILIHDDASTDNTATIIKEYEGKNKDLIKVVYQKENKYSKGLSPTIFLLEKAQGKYLAFCEGDDYWIDDNKLQKQVDFLEKNKNYYATYHNVFMIDENEKELKELQSLYYPLYKSHNIEKRNPRIGFISGQTASIVSRNFYSYLLEKGINWNSYKCNGDAKLATLFYCLGEIFYFEDIMSCYRRTYNTTSWNSRNKGKNLSEYNYNSCFELKKMVKDILGKDIEIEESLLDKLYLSLKFYFSYPTKENLIIFLKLLKKDKEYYPFLKYMVKKICRVILKKIGLMTSEQEKLKIIEEELWKKI